MIKTLIIKHNLDLSIQLEQARKIAKFAIENRNKLSSKYVTHIGLNATFSNSILRKYGTNKKAKQITSVPLVVQRNKLRRIGNDLWIPPLKYLVKLPFKIEKTRGIEIDKDFIYIAYEIQEPKQSYPRKSIGVDLNTTGHCAVVAVKQTGKVYKLGKKAYHVHNKYKSMRKHFQKKGKFNMVKKLKHREANIIKDLNHKISRFIVDLAVKQKGGVSLEKLEGIRGGRKGRKSFKYALHSWSYFQLQKFIEYKAFLAGIPVAYVAPQYTSKTCSKCGTLGERNGKLFKCPKGHVEHADSNAAFNIAKLFKVQFALDRDNAKGITGIPQMATLASVH